MPPGGDGFYYFSLYLRAVGTEFSAFNIELNGDLICSVYTDLTASPSSDEEMTSCSGVTYAVEGIRRDRIF